MRNLVCSRIMHLYLVLPLLYAFVYADTISEYNETETESTALSPTYLNTTNDVPIPNFDEPTINATERKVIFFRARGMVFSGTFAADKEIDAINHQRFDLAVKDLEWYTTWFQKYEPPPQGSDFSIYISHARLRVEWPTTAQTTWSWRKSAIAIATLAAEIRGPAQYHLYPLVMNMDSENNRDPPALRLTVDEIEDQRLEQQTISLGATANLKVTYYQGEQVPIAGIRLALERAKSVVQGQRGQRFDGVTLTEADGAYVEVKTALPMDTTLLAFAILALQEETALRFTQQGAAGSVALRAALQSNVAVEGAVISIGPLNSKAQATS